MGYFIAFIQMVIAAWVLNLMGLSILQRVRIHAAKRRYNVRIRGLDIIKDRWEIEHHRRDLDHEILSIITEF